MKRLFVYEEPKLMPLHHRNVELFVPYFRFMKLIIILYLGDVPIFKNKAYSHYPKYHQYQTLMK